jgi:hypothetical protein
MGFFYILVLFIRLIIYLEFQKKYDCSEDTLYASVMCQIIVWNDCLMHEDSCFRILVPDLAPLLHSSGILVWEFRYFLRSVR